MVFSTIPDLSFVSHSRLAQCMQMFPRRLLTASIRGLATLRDRARIKIDPQHLYEPRFEDPREFPEFPPVILRLRGYDYVPLEKFQSYVHRICRRLNLPVKDRHASRDKTRARGIIRFCAQLFEKITPIPDYSPWST
jgi:hypothetical protein